MSRRVTAALALAVGLALGSLANADDAPEPVIAGLEVHIEGGALQVSFRTESAFGPESLERLQSGMTLVFRHRIELLARRAVPLMPLRVLARTIVEASARYDTLTRQYYLERRTVREVPEETRDAAPGLSTAATSSLAEAQTWMTEVAELPMPAPTPEASLRKPRIRVRTETGRRYRLLIFPFVDAAEAERPLGP